MSLERHANLDLYISYQQQKKKISSLILRIKAENDHYYQYEYVERENMTIDMHDDLIEFYRVFPFSLPSLVVGE